ncbi:Protein of unknown function DUF3669, zinc finger protein [Penicillium italicum]|uniref:DUF3669 domain-containing protein n=1 Tax=Penicillium italicum TaxID=40296 RepID=A0A0A2LMM1_PENIT|nr:Protein of unknown function DUF3669, zinc finger protein [Penicillium italicum]
MTSDLLKGAEVADNSTLHTIGQGFCGTVWASETGPVFKREDGGPDRSLINDFEMHRRVIQSFQKTQTLQSQVQIPACYDYIKITDHKWWSVNHQKFPPGYTTPCNMIQSQRIPPFPEIIRRLLIKKYCPPKIIQEITASDPNKDCLVRPYLGRRRTRKPHTTSQFTAFSLRNFPLHIDQFEELGITTSDISQYARAMAETLAIMHWVGEIDGNDIEFVLAPPYRVPFKMESDALGDHSIWVLDFDLCRRMTMDSKGVEQAAAAFWGNDPYYPRPGIERDILLWVVFREHYLQISEACIGIFNEPHEAERRRALSRQFIQLVEQEGKTRQTRKEKR